MARIKATQTQVARYITQAVFLFYLISISLTHMYRWPGSSAGSLHVYCPMGGLETLPSFVAGGQITLGTNFNDLILLGILVLVTVIFGGGFCGYMCPFGTVQEWLYKLRKLFFKKDLRLPLKVSSILSNIRFVTLIMIILVTFLRGVQTFIPFASVDPYVIFFHFGRETTTPDFVLLLTILLFSLILERGFCAYLCPLGGFVGLMSFGSLTRISKTNDKCISCSLCDKACPVNLTPSGIFEIHRCIMCGRCVDACPDKIATLEYTFAGRSWK